MKKLTFRELIFLICFSTGVVSLYASWSRYQHHPDMLADITLVLGLACWTIVTIIFIHNRIHSTDHLVQGAGLSLENIDAAKAEVTDQALLAGGLYFLLVFFMLDWIPNPFVWELVIHWVALVIAVLLLITSSVGMFGRRG